MLQQSKAHRDAFNYILKNIELSNDDPNAFMEFFMKVQDYKRPSITLYMDEVYHTLGSSMKNPTIYIVSYTNGKGVKRVIIDEGSTINVLSTVAI